MKSKATIRTTFFSFFVFIGLIISCSKQDASMGMEDLKSIYESDDLLIEAIANASNKVSVDITALPNDAKNTLENVYISMMARQSFAVADLGYEVKMVGLEPINLEDDAYTYFDSKGRELVPGYNKLDPRNEGEHEDEKRDHRNKIHFELVYPVSFTMPDGSTISVISKEDFREKVKNWYESNPDSTEKPRLNFPVDVIVKQTVITIENEMQMRALKRRLRKLAELKEKPFEFVFPLQFTMPDDSVLTAESEGALKELLRAWYTANPDIKERPKLIYPVDLKLKNGEIVTINSEEEMKEFRRRIREAMQGPRDRPFKFVYPVSYTMPDASIITAGSEQELKQMIRAWYQENPGTEEKPKINFPVDLELFNGEIVTINSREAMLEFLKNLRELLNGD